MGAELLFVFSRSASLMSGFSAFFSALDSLAFLFRAPWLKMPNTSDMVCCVKERLEEGSEKGRDSTYRKTRQRFQMIDKMRDLQ